MKAWILSVPTDDGQLKLVFADTKGKAKSLATQNGGCAYNADLYVENYTDIRVCRASQFDDMENEPEYDMYVRLLQNGWWFEFGDRVMYTEEDLPEFKKYWKNKRG